MIAQLSASTVRTMDLKGVKLWRLQQQLHPVSQLKTLADHGEIQEEASITRVKILLLYHTGCGRDAASVVNTSVHATTLDKENEPITEPTSVSRPDIQEQRQR